MPRLIQNLALICGLAALACPGLAATAAKGTPPDAPGLSNRAGAYLAARAAAGHNDFAEAAKWYGTALQADSANPDLLQGALVASVAQGDTGAAAKLARALEQAGSNSQLARMVLVADDALHADYAAILKDQANGASIGKLMDGLVTAWAQVGSGKMSQAVATFDKMIAVPEMAAFGMYHKALALAQTGDLDGAARLLAQPQAGAIHGLRRGVLAQVQILSQLGRDTEAVALIDHLYGSAPDLGMAAIRRRLAQGEKIPFDLAQTPQDGMAEAFFTLATLLAGQSNDTFTLMNTRLAVALRPNHVEALLMSARVLDKLGQYDLAIAAYAQVPKDDAAYISATIGQATAAQSAGKPEMAVALLKALAAQNMANAGVLSAYGDSLRWQNQCDAAIGAYTQAIALITTPVPADWTLFYKRGGCHLMGSDWPAAEADYKRALALAPGEPRVLNELGYSYVDRGQNLPLALAMIQQAVTAAPDEGYIVDSLAWAYFRLGRYKDAVAPMEKASLLMPVDPIVTDHLGDVYWSVGRKREAQFQWHRALSFKPEPKDAARIQLKLDKGLDQVLQDEKAKGGNGG
jgi:tetratricopeptide (TPR) repeat protein